MSAFAVTRFQNGMWFKIHCLEIIVLLLLFWYQLFFTPPHKLFYCSNWVHKNTFKKSTGNCEKVSIPRNGNVLILSKMTISRKIEAGRKRFSTIWLTTSLHDVCRDGGRSLTGKGWSWQKSCQSVNIFRKQGQGVQRNTSGIVFCTCRTLICLMKDGTHSGLIESNQRKPAVVPTHIHPNRIKDEDKDGTRLVHLSAHKRKGSCHSRRVDKTNPIHVQLNIPAKRGRMNSCQK